MRTVAFDMTRSNARIYPDEVALVNVFRRLKRNLPTGYGDIHITVEVYGHFGKFIRTTARERAIVSRRTPSFIGAINNVTQSQETEVQERGRQDQSGASQFQDNEHSCLGGGASPAQ